MNAIELRLHQIFTTIVKHGGENDPTVQRVWGAIKDLNFGRMSVEGVKLYQTVIRFREDDWLDYLKFGGGTDSLLQDQAAGFKLEFIRQRDLEDIEMDGATIPAFSYGMMEIFGSDWEDRLKNPRGSQSISVGKIDTGEVKEITTASGKKQNRKVMERISKQIGQALLSLHPIEKCKHPASEEGTLIHEPTPDNLSCGIMIKEIYWALSTKTEKATDSGGDMTGGGSHRKIYIVGLVPHEKSRICGEIGHIQQSVDGVVSLGDFNRLLSDVMLFCDEESDGSLLSECLAANPLIPYYMEKYGMHRFDAIKTATNVYAGVAKDRLTRHGLAPKIWMGRISDDLYKDVQAQASRSARFLESEINQTIRTILGFKKLTSAESLADVNDDIEKWYDEIDPATGSTFYNLAIQKLHLRWRNQTRKTIRDIGTAKFDRNSGELTSLERNNFGKMGRSKDAKRRTFDKSTTVNGARCRTLTTAFIHVEVTCDMEPPCWKELGFQFRNGQWIVSEPMNWIRFFQIGLVAGLDWAAVAVEELQSDEPFVMKRGVEELSKELGLLQSKMVSGIWEESDLDKIMDSTQWEDVARLINRLMLRCSNMSAIGKFQEGNEWLTFRDHLSPESTLIEVRHIDVGELKRLQEARERVIACFEELSERNVLDSLRHPGKWIRKSGGKIGNAVSVERLAEIKAMIAAA